MFLVRCSILFFSMCSLLMATPSSEHFSLFKNKLHPQLLNGAKKSLTVNQQTDFSGTWRMTSKNCILFKKNDTLQIEQNDESLRAYYNGDSEPVIISLGKIYVEGEESESYDDSRDVYFGFWSEDGKTLYFNHFDIVVNKIENNTIISSYAYSIQNNQLHIRYKEQSYSPEFNEKAKALPECVLSRE
jgi:hypothetical protein